VIVFGFIIETNSMNTFLKSAPLVMLRRSRQFA